MWTVRGLPQRLCTGIDRRDFLQVGGLGALGLSLPALARARTARPQTAPASFGRAKHCLLLFLTGGPPQSDTFDLKPNAPAEYRGEFRPVATNVAGIHVGELLPRLARHMDKCCLARSVTHADRIHTSAGYTMLTGAYHPQANGRSAKDIHPGPHDHPHLGALLARAHPSPDGVPAFAALPEVIRDAGVNTYPGQDGGFLGKRFAPFRVETDTARGTFRLPDLVLPRGMTADRLRDREILLAGLDRRLAALERRAPTADLDVCRQQAFRLLGSPLVRQAFDLGREPDRVHEAYGRHLFGQGCLLARRLLEAGVGLVSVYWHYEGPADSPVWDTHQNNFAHLRRRLLPPTDQALAAVIGDLAQRGLLDETLVVCLGEFGRSPRVNKLAGRDHWPHVQTVLLAGGGIRGGRVYGASDKVAAYPADRPVTPPDLAATLLHLLGVPPGMEIQDQTGRPIAACQGQPVAGLLA